MSKFGEPWDVHRDTDGFRSWLEVCDAHGHNFIVTEIDEDDERYLHRAATLVNALSGIKNLEKWVAALRELIEAVKAAKHQVVYAPFSVAIDIALARIAKEESK